MTYAWSSPAIGACLPSPIGSLMTPLVPSVAQYQSSQ